MTTDVTMPLGVTPNKQFTAFVGAFHVITPYGLRQATGSETEPQLSETLDIRIAAADPAGLLHAAFDGVLSYIPGSTNQPGTLRLNPVYSAVALSKAFPGSGFPKALVYGNVSPASVTAAAPVLLLARPKDKRAQEQAEFLAGTRAISVACGLQIGRADTKNAPAGFRLLRLSAIDSQSMLVNPAHFLLRFPEIDPSLKGHPLLKVFDGVQTELRFPFKSGGKKRFVLKGSAGSDGQFLSPATASPSLSGAIGAAQDGDIVVVLDSATYPIAVTPAPKKTVQIISIASFGLQDAPPASAVLPKLTPATGTHMLSLGAGAVGLIGFRLEGGTAIPGYGGAILIESGVGSEIAYNVLQSNSASQGGAIALRTSRRILITRNLIQKNDATGDESSVAFKGRGGGVCILSCASVRLTGNVIVENVAGNFGGGVAIVRSSGILIQDNTIGDETTKIGNQVTGDSPSFSEFIDGTNPRGGGGGIGVHHGEVSIVANRLRHNKASRGGGIEMFGQSHGTIRNNWIELNQARPSLEELGGDGGGIAVNPISTTAAEVLATKVIVIAGNHIGWNIAGDDGGGIYGTARCVLALAANEIHHNAAFHNGGGIRVTFGSFLTLDGGSITSNTCNVSPEKGGGGGFSMFNSVVTLKNCRIEGNEASKFGGGGVYAMAADYDADFETTLATVLGKSFDQLLEVFGVTQIELTLINCAIPKSGGAANIGTAGGGLYIVHKHYPFRLVIKNTWLGGNVSTHANAAKKADVVIENTETSAIVNSTSDPQLANLLPLPSFDRTFTS